MGHGDGLAHTDLYVGGTGMYTAEWRRRKKMKASSFDIQHERMSARLCRPCGRTHRCRAVQKLGLSGILDALDGEHPRSFHAFKHDL